MSSNNYLYDFFDNEDSDSNTDAVSEADSLHENVDANSDSQQEVGEPGHVSKAKENVENLTVKDQETRLKNVQSLLRVIQHHYADDYLSGSTESIVKYCEKGLQRGDLKEMIFSSKLLFSLLLTFPDLRIGKKTLSSLLSYFKDVETEIGVRTVALTTYIGYFFITEDEVDDQVIENIKFLFNVEDELSPVALQMYSIHLTRYEDEALATQFEEVSNLLIESLEEVDISLEFQIAAGTLLSQIMSACIRTEDTESDYMKYRLTELLGEISISSSKRKKKTDTKELKNRFKEFHNTFESGEEPSHSIRLNGHEISFDGWNQLIIYQFLKSILKGGLPHHLIHNDFVRSLLDLQTNFKNVKSLSKIEKQNRSKYSQHSRSRGRETAGEFY